MAKTKENNCECEVLNFLKNELYKNDKSKIFLRVLNSLPNNEIIELYNELITSAFEKMMSDIELVSCVVDLFKNNLNVSETSRDSFLHRNTLLYRLEKIQKLTGLNIKNFEDAVTFKILMVVYYERKKIN